MTMATDLGTHDRSAHVVPPEKRGFFGHPWGLANLAGVEMWERFSFYGMQALLAYYIYYTATEGGLGMSEVAATSIVGAYGGMVYLSSILGAWVADRLLGSERTLLTATVLIMLGHISLAALPGTWGLGVGLVCVGVGAGTLKATTSTVLGDMYAPEDNTRDSAFTIYYMGVNLGALVGPLLTGLLWQAKGFHWGFGLAAMGMFLGLVQYVIMRRRTITAVGVGAPNPLTAQGRRNLVIGVVAAAVVIAVAAWAGLLAPERLSTIVVVLTILASVGLFAMILSSSRITPDERSRVISFIPMFLASATFWSLFQQQFTVVAIYAEQRLDRNLFGWEMPPSWVNSINPIFIIIFAGVFAAMWTKMGDRQPVTPLKFALGTAIMGAAFLMFLPWAGGGPNSTPLLGLTFILFLFTCAELCLSPVGQSLATKLAPQAFHTQMVALFFLSIAVGSAAAGTLARFYNAESEHSYFLFLGGASIVVGIVMAVLSPWISRLMRGVR